MGSGPRGSADLLAVLGTDFLDDRGDPRMGQVEDVGQEPLRGPVLAGDVDHQVAPELPTPADAGVRRDLRLRSRGGFDLREDRAGCHEINLSRSEHPRPFRIGAALFLRALAALSGHPSRVFDNSRRSVFAARPGSESTFGVFVGWVSLGETHRADGRRWRGGLRRGSPTLRRLSSILSQSRAWLSTLSRAIEAEGEIRINGREVC